MCLQDLMLQAEILVRSGMRSKAIERLQRIRSFPARRRAQSGLQQLYLAAGMTPYHANSTPHPPASSAVKAAPAAAPSPAARPLPRNPPMSIASPKWRTSRESFTGRPMPMRSCPPRSLRFRRGGRSAAASWPPASRGWCQARNEDSGERVKAGEAQALSRLVTAVRDVAISEGTFTLADAAAAPELQEIREVLVQLGITSSRSRSAMVRTRWACSR